MITKIRKALGWPFSVLSKTLVILAIMVYATGSVIAYGLDETINRLTKLRNIIETLKG